MDFVCGWAEDVVVASDETAVGFGLLSICVDGDAAVDVTVDFLCRGDHARRVGDRTGEEH